MAEIVNVKDKDLPENCYVFKHSTRCPVSFAAADEVKASSPSLPIHWINVVEQRELSNWVAKEYNTEHQSPQLLRIKNGAVEKVWNHSAIKASEIT